MMQTAGQTCFGYHSVRYFKYLRAQRKCGSGVLWKNNQQENGANLYNY